MLSSLVSFANSSPQYGGGELSFSSKHFKKSHLKNTQQKHLLPVPVTLDEPQNTVSKC